jgi:hypothetical protein
MIFVIFGTVVKNILVFKTCCIFKFLEFFLDYLIFFYTTKATIKLTRLNTKTMKNLAVLIV